MIFPRGIQDVCHIARLASEPRFQRVVVVPRGGGTGTNGQSLTEGLVVDLSKHMNRILEINIKERWARVEAGVVKDQLGAEAARCARDRKDDEDEDPDPRTPSSSRLSVKCTASPGRPGSGGRASGIAHGGAIHWRARPTGPAPFGGRVRVAGHHGPRALLLPAVRGPRSSPGGAADRGGLPTRAGSPGGRAASAPGSPRPGRIAPGGKSGTMPRTLACSPRTRPRPCAG